MPEPEPVTIPSRFGRLSAVLQRPTAPAPVPAVLLCQGLSGVKHLVLPDVAAEFAARGLATLRFDYLGYGDSEGERGWIDPHARVDDAVRAFAWLAQCPGIDASRLGVYGHSYGGPVAITLASRERRARAVVSVSGPGCGRKLMRSVRASWDWIALLHRLEDDRRAFATSGESQLVPITEIFPFSPAFQAAYDKLKAQGRHGTSAMEASTSQGEQLFHLASIDAMIDFHPEDAARRLGERPVLFVHGEDDDAALLDDVLEVHANVPGPKELVVFPGLAHNDLDSGAGLTRAVGLAADWFTTHLTAAVSAGSTPRDR